MLARCGSGRCTCGGACRTNGLEHENDDGHLRRAGSARLQRSVGEWFDAIGETISEGVETVEQAVESAKTKLDTLADLASAPARPSDPFDEFVAEVRKIATVERRATDDELEMLAGILDRLAGEDPSGIRRRRLEKEILLWPWNFRALNDIVELVTGARNPLAADIMDKMDAVAARFEEAAGEKLKNELVKAAKGYPKAANNCLNFLEGSGVRRLSSGSPAEVQAAKKRYREGVKERLAATKPGNKPRHAATLSRLAAELRIAGLVGSARLMHWNGKRYRPPATAHFERLTGAGDGWYFFLVSVGSFHTFVIAVRVTGENRKYVKIEDGGAVRKYDADLNEYFDHYGAEYGAAARFWPVYAAPTPFASAPAAGSGTEDDEPVILEDDEPVILE